ncbi:MAG: hypothetical protein ACK4YP_16020, partial [Myxococcota bacterium]
GVLGGSVYLDALSERVHTEMGLAEGVLFYAFDAEQRLALTWDAQHLLRAAEELGPELQRAMTEMQANDAGTLRYNFREGPRTVVYRRSEVTGWWYVFGVVDAPAAEG